MIKSFHRRHGGNFPRKNVSYNKSKASRATGAIESPSRTANRESRTRSNYWLSQWENQDGVCLSVTCPAEILCRTSRRQMIGRQCRREKTRDESHRGGAERKQGWACNSIFLILWCVGSGPRKRSQCHSSVFHIIYTGFHRTGFNLQIYEINITSISDSLFSSLVRSQ